MNSSKQEEPEVFLRNSEALMKQVVKDCRKGGLLMNRTALFVIDAQVGNLEGSESVYDSGNLLIRIQQLIEKARKAGALVIYVQHCGPEGEIDEPNTPTWEIHPAIAPQTGDTVIQKQHPDAFQETRLQHELESESIDTVIIAGVQTEYCVDTTCRRAYSLGYDVILVRDAHSTYNSDTLTAPQIIAHHTTVLGGWFAELKEADEIWSDKDIGTERTQNHSRR
jgi:nicotinamidase-related amidase